MFNNYTRIALILSCCLLFTISIQCLAVPAKTLHKSCQQKETKMLCDGFFIGTYDAHITSMILQRRLNGKEKCKKWGRYTPDMLIASFNAEYLAPDSAFKPDDDPAIWIMSEVFDKAGCQKGIEI